MASDTKKIEKHSAKVLLSFMFPKIIETRLFNLKRTGMWHCWQYIMFGVSNCASYWSPVVLYTESCPWRPGGGFVLCRIQWPIYCTSVNPILHLCSAVPVYLWVTFKVLCLINQDLSSSAYHFLRDKSFFSVVKARGFRKIRLLGRLFLILNTLILCQK